ncbi:MAG: hypothetical protein ABI439_00560 [Rhodospirillales bacterium]
MLVTEIEHHGSQRIWLMDSIAAIAPEHQGAFVLTGSHGGQSAGEYALKFPLAAVFFNDAGIGKDEAGVVGLKMLQAKGTIAGAVSHDSGRIGDAMDMWNNGTISRLNDAAGQGRPAW